MTADNTTMFLSINRRELIQNTGSNTADFVIVSGDAYVDHPSFGTAVIGRIVESCGFKVGIVAQPQNDADYQEFGEPKCAFLIAGGVVDSMVNNYYSSLKKRTRDEYSEGGIYGKRPDRCVDVYAKTLKRLFPFCPVIAGGLEASLRRLAHYDYWSDSIRASILVTSGVDLVVYGMGENPIVQILEYAKKGINLAQIKDICGTAYLTNKQTASKKLLQSLELLQQKNKCIDGKQNIPKQSVKLDILPSKKQITDSKRDYFDAFDRASQATTEDITLIQYQDDDNFVVVNPPSKPLQTAQLDKVYDLPYQRKAHPIYKKGVPALEEVEFGVTAHRGCFGNCAFCAITYHQGRIIQTRSEDSIIQEVENIANTKGFKGYIHDIGGPTANFHKNSCDKQLEYGICSKKDCVGIANCNKLKVDHSQYLSVLRRARQVKGVKKVFVRSGIRFDYIMADMDRAFLEELVKYHTSGQLKVAPEHASDSVLKYMNKPPFETYLAFKREFDKATKACGMAKQYLVPYFISGHPGCTVEDAIKLTEYLKSIGYMPLQVQDFYPTPSTLATTMYYTEMDKQRNPIFVAKTKNQKAIQRALLQWRLPKNKELCEQAYRMVKYSSQNEQNKKFKKSKTATHYKKNLRVKN